MAATSKADHPKPRGAVQNRVIRVHTRARGPDTHEIPRAAPVPPPACWSP
eukprot:CAMPEP_0204352862 /NCGR_PEP_ID=MMETSP0469-20131031/32223_1 /ASSEMBLY_ACC=CAM_ASM_000384 /TAXON_ID=2969 /ORGANISM="Oxyrrhis marina" /LENGTH=49 /DNA_ID= /DNA_START= /DNA_END= /DNA_ORIENTATION=